MNDITKHRRVNDILLGPLERPALKWLAEHSPVWITPDTLTLVGFIGTVVITISYLLTRLHPGFLWLASLGYIINWYGDSLDGTLARHRHIERPRFGFFIDHTMDAIGELMVVLALGISPFVRFELACLVLIGYQLMSNVVFIITCVSGEFRISYGKLGPTEVRVLLILANIVAFFTRDILIRTPWIALTIFDIVIIIIAALLFFFAIKTAIVKTIEFRNKGE